MAPLFIYCASNLLTSYVLLIVKIMIYTLRWEVHITQVHTIYIWSGFPSMLQTDLIKSHLQGRPCLTLSEDSLKSLKEHNFQLSCLVLCGIALIRQTFCKQRMEQ